MYTLRHQSDLHYACATSLARAFADEAVQVFLYQPCQYSNGGQKEQIGRPD